MITEFKGHKNIKVFYNIWSYVKIMTEYDWKRPNLEAASKK